MMMITLTSSFLFPSPPPHHPFQLHPHFPRQKFPLPLSSPRVPLPCPPPLRRRPDRRRSLVVANAGPPSTASLFLVFFLPLSLLLVTIFTSIRIADKLDQDFLEELALYEDMVEDGGVSEEEEVEAPSEPEPALSRVRNRPKREAAS